MFGPDRLLVVVEVDEIPGPDVHGADAEADLSRVDPVEINKVLERLSEWARVVKSRRPAVGEPGERLSWYVHSWLAEED